MPFLSQDAEYLRCAHAVLWMVLRHTHLAHGLPRHLTAEVHDAALGGVIVGRQVPSEGLSVQQMLAGATPLEVADPFAEAEDAHRPWQTAILPLLPAIYVTAERAEAAGRLWFAGYLRSAAGDEPVARAAAAGELTFRTYAVLSDQFLEGLAARGV